MNNKPQNFFKYHSINNHLFELFKENSFWFSSAEDLNDNMEFKYTLSHDYYKKTINEASNCVLEEIKKINSAFENVDKVKFNNALDLTFQSEKWSNNLYNHLFQSNPFGVCCFTIDPLDELMWAHYASGSKGVCLNFDFSSTSDSEMKIHPVNYTNDFLPISTPDETYDALLRKRLPFQYEREWRMLSFKNSKLPFSKESLIEVIFGFNVSKENKEKIIASLNENGYSHVKLKQVRMELNGINLFKIEEKHQP